MPQTYNTNATLSQPIPKKRRYQTKPTKRTITDNTSTTTGTAHTASEQEKIKDFIDAFNINPRKLGLPDRYDFKTLSNAKRARNAQRKGMTMNEYSNWNREQTARHRNMGVVIWGFSIHIVIQWI